MYAKALQKTYDLQGFLDLETRSQIRHEFHNGTVYVTAGGTANHSTLTVNFIAELRNHLKGNPCRVHGPDMRVRIQKLDKVIYPDTSVTCVEEAGSALYLEHPVVVIEVLSPKTQQYDRTTKFETYRTLASLRGYILVGFEKQQIEVYSRIMDAPNDPWTYISFSKENFEIPSIGYVGNLNTIYENTSIPVKLQQL